MLVECRYNYDKTMSLFWILRSKWGLQSDFGIDPKGVAHCALGTGKKKKNKKKVKIYSSINTLKKFRLGFGGWKKMILASPIALIYERMVP